MNVKNFTQMDDCARWLKSRDISAEVGLDYIFILFENSKNIALQDKSIPFWLLKELAEQLPCKFVITWFVPDPNDPHELWYCRKRIPSDKGLLIELEYRLFGDSGGPVHTEDV